MKLKNNKIDWIIEIMCLTLLIGLTAYLIFHWGSIPDKIPAHYDWEGNIDRWGNKSDLIFLPMMSWFLYLLITGLQQVPLAWNTGVKITGENEERVYRTLKYMLETLKMIVPVAVFGDLIFWIVRLYQVKYRVNEEAILIFLVMHASSFVFCISDFYIKTSFYMYGKPIDSKSM